MLIKPNCNAKDCGRSQLKRRQPSNFKTLPQKCNLSRDLGNYIKIYKEAQYANLKTAFKIKYHAILLNTNEKHYNEKKVS